MRHLLPSSRLRPAVATAVAASLLLTGCGGASSGGGDEADGDTLTLGLTYTPDPQFAPFYVAEELGYFEDAGVDVKLRHHGESEELFGALKNGTEQIVYGGGDEITQARAGGADITSIATLYNTYPAVLIVPEDSKIKTAKDLKGRTVGIPGRYGQTYFALLALMDSAGLTEDDVKIQAIGYTQQAALTSSRVDAVMGFSNNDAVQFGQADFDVRTITAVDEDRPQLVGPALGADKKTIESRSEDTEHVLEAVKRGIEYTEKHPEKTIDITAKYVPTLGNDKAKSAALATLKATLPLMEPDGDDELLTNNPQDWARMAKFMKSASIIDDQPEAEQLYTNDLLP